MKQHAVTITNSSKLLESYAISVTVGIIGLGFMGTTHLQAFRQSPGVTIGAVCSSHATRLSSAIEGVAGNLAHKSTPIDLGDAARYDDWRDLISDPRLDAVDICLPTDLHAAVALSALNAGKDVLLEKPMALDVDACDRLLQAARNNKRVLMVAHVLRFWPEYKSLAQFVTSLGEGELQSVVFERRCGLPVSPWQQNAQRSGGALFDLLIHDIDQALSLFGMPESVRAVPFGGLDTADAVLSYASGLEVRIRGGWYAGDQPFEMSFRAVSELKTLSLEGGVLTQSGSGSAHVEKVPQQDAFQNEIDYFAHCVKHREEPNLNPPAQSVLAVKVAVLLDHSRARGGVELACNL